MILNASNKVLILRFSSIGDIVLTSPIVRCLKLQTGVEIHFVCKKPFKGILENNPHIDKVFFFEKSLKEIEINLKAENYNAIIDLHKNLRTFQLKKRLGIPHFTFDKLNIPKWLMVNFKINRLPNIHIVDRYFQAVQFANIYNDGQGLDYFIPPKDQVSLPQFLPKVDCSSFIAFAIGAAHATKRLPETKIIEIVQKIQKPILLLGGKAEFDVGERIAQLGGKHIYNLCGKLNLNQSASVVQQAKLVLTPDTGMMHIAAAFQKKIISIWGNTIPEFGMYPYFKKDVEDTRNTMIEVKNLSCRPCSKIGYDTCPKQHFNCMQKIDVEAILEEVKGV